MESLPVASSRLRCTASDQPLQPIVQEKTGGAPHLRPMHSIGISERRKSLHGEMAEHNIHGVASVICAAPAGLEMSALSRRGSLIALPSANPWGLGYLLIFPPSGSTFLVATRSCSAARGPQSGCLSPPFIFGPFLSQYTSQPRAAKRSIPSKLQASK